MISAGWLTIAIILIQVLVQLGVLIRVILRRLPTGVAASWIVLVLVFPVVGASAYLLVGESRIGRKREKREAYVHPAYREYLKRLRARTRHIPRELSIMDARLSRETEAATGIPALGGNSVELLESTEQFLDEVTAAIGAAQRTILCEFFIWHSAGRVLGVERALIEAASRGVECRVLVDAVGSRRFFPAERRDAMRSAGIRVAAALPATFGRTPIFRRVDHRNHRKLFVVDEQTAFVGGMNMVDPAHFKAGAGVGEWVDLIARVRGPAVELYTLLVARDWETEVAEDLGELRRSLEGVLPEPAGEMALQIVPSGPGQSAGFIQALVLSAIYAAERTLTVTTPYFVPDQAILTALQSAARRGVAVTVIVPARSDTALTHYAGRAFFQDLLDAGVRIAEFCPGLLHTKSIVVDDEITLFGTVNIDPRSLWLNFELTTIAYDNDLARAIHERQQCYIGGCSYVDPEAWRRRPMYQKLASHVAQLFSPLL
ncbi:MAG TPA: cardiolipin synthase [Phycisphaerales bacterium]|nr:cardiolipin synthase [Phycisphaerales bacterium]